MRDVKLATVRLARLEFWVGWSALWTKVLSLQMDGKMHVKCARALSSLGNRLDDFPKTYLIG